MSFAIKFLKLSLLLLLLCTFYIFVIQRSSVRPQRSLCYTFEWSMLYSSFDKEIFLRFYSKCVLCRQNRRRQEWKWWRQNEIKKKSLCPVRSKMKQAMGQKEIKRRRKKTEFKQRNDLRLHCQCGPIHSI